MFQKAERPRGRPRSFDESAALEKATRVFRSKGYDGTTIDDLVDTRLEEKNRQKSRGEDLHQIDCGGCVQSCHDPRSLTELIQICRCPECLFKKKGRGFSRVPFW